MKCLTCYWWDGEEGETASCYAALPVMHGEGIYGEWPLTDENARCPKYRRHWRKTLVALYRALRRWWYLRGEQDED